MPPFLITGTPRSRTAWFAALCNTVPDTVCYHEPVAYHATWREAARLWGSKWRTRVGIADSGFALHLADLVPMYHPRVLVIDRPHGDVDESLARIGVAPSNYCELLEAAIAPWAESPLVKQVEFDALASSDVVRECLWHLLPGAAIDRDKIDVFQRLNVQTDLPKMWRAIEGRNAADMMGEDAAANLRATGD